MADKDFLGDRRRTQEDAYFHKKEQELIAKLQQRAAERAARERLAGSAGTADEEVLSDLQELGYTPETIALLHLVPLLQMAWAEGNVSDRERELIVEAARSRGIQAGSPADAQLQAWLANRPAEALFEKTLRAVSTILQGRPDAERAADQKDLLANVEAIASASGGILGFGAVSDSERQVLSRISLEMQRNRSPKS